MHPAYMYIGDTQIVGTYIEDTPQGSNYYVTWVSGFNHITLEPTVHYELVYHSHYKKVRAYLDDRVSVLAKLKAEREAAWQAHLEHLRNN